MKNLIGKFFLLALTLCYVFCMVDEVYASYGHSTPTRQKTARKRKPRPVYTPPLAPIVKPQPPPKPKSQIEKAKAAMAAQWKRWQRSQQCKDCVDARIALSTGKSISGDIVKKTAERVTIESGGNRLTFPKALVKSINSAAYDDFLGGEMVDLISVETE